MSCRIKCVDACIFQPEKLSVGHSQRVGLHIYGYYSMLDSESHFLWQVRTNNKMFIYFITFSTFQYNQHVIHLHVTLNFTFLLAYLLECAAINLKKPEKQKPLILEQVLHYLRWVRIATNTHWLLQCNMLGCSLVDVGSDRDSVAVSELKVYNYL